MPGKRRTREHVIADLGVNHVERHALLAGYTVDRFAHDYGLDLILVTYDQAGEVEPGPIYLQVKATDSLSVLGDGQTVVCRVEQAALQRWLAERIPVSNCSESWGGATGGRGSGRLPPWTPRWTSTAPRART